ncbi:MAG: RRXRR domain-containing protein [Candidatus Methanoculleus thermohydrogenotrophicum]
MRVPVLDTNRRPLTPTTPARARLLLKQGKAKPYWNKLGIFSIILTYAVEPDNQPLVVGLDPGSSFEGWSVVGTRETVANGMLEAPKTSRKQSKPEERCVAPVVTGSAGVVLPGLTTGSAAGGSCYRARLPGGTPGSEFWTSSRRSCRSPMWL